MSEANVEVLGRAWDAWQRGDFPALFDLYDPEIVWDMTHFRDWPESTYHGIEGTERFLREWLAVWADYEVEVDDILAAPDGRAIALFRQRGKGRSSGIGMELEQAHIATVRDGKITRVDNYADRTEALEALGLSE